MQFAADFFMGMFQNKSDKGKIKVYLAHLRNGEVAGHAEGQGKLNVLYATKDKIGYGWPVQRSHDIGIR